MTEIHSDVIYSKLNDAITVDRKVVVYAPCPWLNGLMMMDPRDARMLLLNVNKMLVVHIIRDTKKMLMLHILGESKRCSSHQQRLMTWEGCPDCFSEREIHG